MTNQSLDQRPRSLYNERQYNDERYIARIEEQGVALGSLITTAAVVYDETRRELDAIVNKGGRATGHQRYVEERTASLQNIFDGAMQALVRKGTEVILHREPTEIVVKQIHIHAPEPRKSFFQSITGR